jgi:lipopolysaccharide transport system ATP-binding protein
VSRAIDLQGVTLVRRTQQEFHYDFKRTALNLMRGRWHRVHRRTVLENVDVAIAHGEKVAIIGPNGSGKSTLLKVIAGILTPTRGSSSIDGQVAPLIELGVGFDLDLSLVDNIIYYGVLLGHPESKMHNSIDSILDFAELQPYRDEPTKTLSSGMGARLGFAIATEFRPDILLLDEVLAVGDERFRRKCAARIERFWDANVTIVVVSHDLGYVTRTCDRVIWMESGRVRFDGPATAGAQRYLDTVPEMPTFRRGEELVALADASDRREIVVRGTSETEQGMKVFLIRDGRRHWVTTQEWYEKTGYAWEDIIHVDDAVILEVPEGEILA